MKPVATDSDYTLLPAVKTENSLLLLALTALQEHVGPVLDSVEYCYMTPRKIEHLQPLCVQL